VKSFQSQWTATDGWSTPLSDGPAGDADLVLLFGGGAPLRDPERRAEIRAAFPTARLAGCSTAGEIRDVLVYDDTLVLTAIAFEDTRVSVVSVAVDDASASEATGRILGSRIDPTDLGHVFVLSDGLAVNGSELVSGLRASLPDGVTLTGGLSGDGDRFGETLVLVEDEVSRNRIVAIGFHGERIRVGYGSLGGWDPFGPDRLVTRSEGNMVYSLDGRSALSLYKEYLGEHAAGLPSTGLLFPLSVRIPGQEHALVRTILAVDEEEQSLTFAGDVPEGSHARLMKANFERLIEGAGGAASASHDALGTVEPELAILISCVGRKLVLQQRTEEEVERVREVLGEGAILTGFYSYGELCPLVPGEPCELHNQTMTITTFREAA